MGVPFCWIGHYRRGMRVYDQLNPQTITNQWKAFKDEVIEFCEAVVVCDVREIWDELHDVVHSFLRLLITVVAALPLIGPALLPVLVLLPALGYKTARKHALRHRDKGCIRSARHCEKEPCDHICPRYYGCAVVNVNRCQYVPIHKFKIIGPIFFCLFRLANLNSRTDFP